jgi:hypothetical protein
MGADARDLDGTTLRELHGECRVDQPDRSRNLIGHTTQLDVIRTALRGWSGPSTF